MKKVFILTVLFLSQLAQAKLPEVIAANLEEMVENMEMSRNAYSRVNQAAQREMDGWIHGFTGMVGSTHAATEYLEKADQNALKIQQELKFANTEVVLEVSEFLVTKFHYTSLETSFPRRALEIILSTNNAEAMLKLFSIDRNILSWYHYRSFSQGEKYDVIFAAEKAYLQLMVIVAKIDPDRLAILKSAEVRASQYDGEELPMVELREACQELVDYSKQSTVKVLAQDFIKNYLQ